MEEIEQQFVSEVRDLLITIKKRVSEADYMCGAPHWETKRRWDVQAKLGHVKGLIFDLETKLMKHENERKH